MTQGRSIGEIKWVSSDGLSEHEPVELLIGAAKCYPDGPHVLLTLRQSGGSGDRCEVALSHEDARQLLFKLTSALDGGRTQKAASAAPGRRGRTWLPH